MPATTPYTPLIMAADAISASRPGARRESLERYIKRLQELEELAMTFDGVRQACIGDVGGRVNVVCALSGRQARCGGLSIARSDELPEAHSNNSPSAIARHACSARSSSSASGPIGTKCDPCARWFGPIGTRRTWTELQRVNGPMTPDGGIAPTTPDES